MEFDDNMDNMDNMEFDDNIRKPDEIKTEQLIPNEDTYNSSFNEIYDNDTISNDFEINEAINLSLKDFNERKIMNEEYEKKLMDDFNEEINKRKLQFKELLININKLSKYDKEIKEVYDIIEPIIDAYCSINIDYCELDEETYKHIFKVLYSLRKNKESIEFLRNIIIVEKKIIIF